MHISRLILPIGASVLAVGVMLGASVRASQPVGHLDWANLHWAAGWAYDPDHSSSPIAVHAYVDGQFAGAAATDVLREDVNAAFGISGTHGFHVPIDVAAFGPGPHDVVVYGIDADGEGNPGLAGSPVAVVAPATAPEGHLDVAQPGQIAGWAKDPSHDGPIPVHIYVDGALAKALLASDWRADVGAHGFNWAPPPFGAGTHQVVAYAIGVDAQGVPNDENPSLAGSPKSLSGGCAGLTGSAYGWCAGMPPYWSTRQSDTEYVGNDTVRAGINRSFGGTVFQLYGSDWQTNTILEHGGGAVQLSIWGYDPKGPAAWFGYGACDATPYGSQAACLAGGHASCALRAHSQGAHVSDCVTSTPCTGWTAGAPWNPIQAQAASCGWTGPTNDVAQAAWQGSRFYTDQPWTWHFTSTHPAVPLRMEQWAEAGTGWVRLDYRLTYTGATAWSPHPQEIPAIFTAADMAAHFYWYGGTHPFTGDSVTHHVGVPPTGMLRIPGAPSYPHPDFAGYVREGWWGVCDAAETRCLTVATFSPLVREAAVSDNGTGEGYLTALGGFAVEPGMDLQWSVYLFPYRYDAVVADKTVRQRIYELTPPGYAQATCLPQCDGKACGSNSCGGTCGFCPAAASCVVGGDVNDSGDVDITDVQCTVITTLWTLAGAIGSLPTCATLGIEALDLDCSTTVALSDVQLIVQLALDQPIPASLDADGSGCVDACDAAPCIAGQCK